MQDVRYARRLLVRSPGYSLVVIAVLAVGIGSNVLAFALFKALALTPLAGVAQGSRLEFVGALSSSDQTYAFSDPNYRDLRDRLRTSTGLAGSSFQPGRCARATARNASASNWSAAITSTCSVSARISAACSSWPMKAAGSSPIAVLSASLWRSAFQ
jgi:hypothetical protein